MKTCPPPPPHHTDRISNLECSHVLVCAEIVMVYLGSKRKWNWSENPPALHHMYVLGRVKE
jgi:hypothetical protein